MAVVFQTNGVDNGNQNKLNLVGGANVVLSEDGAGDVTIGTTSNVSVGHFVSDGGVSLPSGATPSEYDQNQSTATITGSGLSLGNSGGWSVGKNELLTLNDAVRGIHQGVNLFHNKHAVGDTAGFYGYVNYDGGYVSQSDEGVTGITVECVENAGYYHGTVARTTGTGDRAPMWSPATSGSNWTTDGAFMLDISKPTATAEITGNALFTPTISGVATTTDMFYLVCGSISSSRGKFPLTTALGIQVLPTWSSTVSYALNEIVSYSDGHFYLSLIANNLNDAPASTPSAWKDLGTNAAGFNQIPFQNVTRDNPVPTTFTVKLYDINGVSSRNSRRGATSLWVDTATRSSLLLLPLTKMAMARCGSR